MVTLHIYIYIYKMFFFLQNRTTNKKKTYHTRKARVMRLVCYKTYLECCYLVTITQEKLSLKRLSYSSKWKDTLFCVFKGKHGINLHSHVVQWGVINKKSNVSTISYYIDGRKHRFNLYILRSQSIWSLHFSSSQFGL